MSYHTQFQLAGDSDFNGRSQAATLEQAAVFVNDARLDFVALAQSVLRGELETLAAFTRLDAAAPGLADKVEIEGGIDQSQVTDGDLLSATQANWPTLAEALYNDDGSPKP